MWGNNRYSLLSILALKRFTPHYRRLNSKYASPFAPSPPLPPPISRNLAVIVCEFPAYFAPCLLFRIAGDGNWQRISTGMCNSPVSRKARGLPTSTSTRSLHRKPRVILRKEDFVSFWRDHVYGRGRRQRLCSLLRHYENTQTCGTQRICTAALRVLIRGLVKWHPDLSSLRDAPDTEVRVKHYVSMVIATMQASISRSAACITTSDILNSNLVDSFYMVQDFLTSAFELMSITRFEAAHQVWKDMLKHERGRAALKTTRLGDGLLKCGCGDHTVAESNSVDEEYVTMDNKSLRSRLRLNEAVLERIFAGYAKPLASAYEQSIGFEVRWRCVRLKKRCMTVCQSQTTYTCMRE